VYLSFLKNSLESAHTTKKVKNYIKNLRNKGIVIVSHNLEDLDVCNRNLQIENGKIFEL